MADRLQVHRQVVTVAAAHLAAVLTLACSPTTDTTEWRTEQVANGVAHIDVDMGLLADVDTVLTRVTLQHVRGNGTAYELERVAMVARDTEDSQLVVVDHGAARVVAISESGAVRWEFGRRGAGPGEFRSIASAFLARGSVWISDGANRTLTQIDLDDGSLIRVRALPITEESPRPVVNGMCDNGVPVISSLVFQLRSRVDSTRTRVGRWIGDDSVALLNLPLQSSTWVVVGTRDSYQMAKRPFSVEPSVAVGKQIVILDPASDALHVVSCDGVLRMSIHFKNASTRVTRTMIESAAKSTSRNPAGGVDLSLYKALRDLDYGGATPSFDQVRMDDGGRYWLRQYKPSMQWPETWLVVDAAVRTRTFVVMPDRFALHTVIGSDVYGVAFDECDVAFPAHVRL